MGSSGSTSSLQDLTFYSLWIEAETVIRRKVTAASLICPEASAHSVYRNADLILFFLRKLKNIVCMIISHSIIDALLHTKFLKTELL